MNEDNSFYRLKDVAWNQSNGSHYYVVCCPVYFYKGTSFSIEDVKKCSQFAYEVSQRPEAFDNKIRSEFQIFLDTLEGKLGEEAVYHQLMNIGFQVSPINFEKYPRGQWDTTDLVISVNGNIKNIQIKTTKCFGQLLLLSKKDWDKQGLYIPDRNIHQNLDFDGRYDLIIFQRISLNTREIKKNIESQFQIAKAKNNFNDLLKKIIEYFEGEEKLFQYDKARFITYSELTNQIIGKNYLIRKNDYLRIKQPNENCKNLSNVGKKFTRMQTDNYYVQINNMHTLNELPNLFNI